MLESVKTKLYYGLIGLSLVSPVIALAQTDTVSPLIARIGEVFRTITGVLFVLATVVFLWGVIQFIAKSGDPEGQKKAKGIMTWGIVGLAVMAAAWGVANILINFFGAGNISPGFVNPPRFP